MVTPIPLRINLPNANSVLLKPQTTRSLPKHALHIIFGFGCFIRLNLVLLLGIHLGHLVVLLPPASILNFLLRISQITSVKVVIELFETGPIGCTHKRTPVPQFVVYS